MKKTILTLLLSFYSVLAFSAGGGGYPLDKIETDPSDKPSLQRGAALYQNYCSGCHSTEFQRYERVADDLGIPHDLMMENLVFNKDAKIGDLMTNAMAREDAKAWFGAAPPDLTMVTRVRGEDWVYTYLRTFYEDPKRPWGVNNKVFPDVGMPHALLELQGVQLDSCNGEDPTKRDPLTGQTVCGLTIDPERKGSMTPSEYDQAIYDLVNFLAYSAEPMKAQRQQLGIYVMLFLVLLFIFTFLLKREYWKDVH
ncbi:cytochrome c1 [Endozoicomonas gorgoniicola]|uniref:Cytochrome c1 n=1 Tax=Endozoicomonas gorgoniicola TaxID=1234144 RepID=A0ABT3MPE3_9GAMM|nr:cytochrome c1 [Endozoicomonas gorgoniicola]MCW7551221.1 cytochrome c1 [Endozoicomonas gorgoniicola]